ncbi:hypothetical protein QAD02_009722 [Eretmocerus hayati]|uniref:Uncharacterized protein n=1 Tax=Eretmocerus hayati TaxID=131215 RepID=A0ACC2NCK4_9HYME|nr:hypothetical protein QAD02_009722 [Eretmocerus hayati]
MNYHQGVMNLHVQQTQQARLLQQQNVAKQAIDQARAIAQAHAKVTQPVVLDSSAAIKLAMGTAPMYTEKALMSRNDIWHRILIKKGSQHDKELVLKSILKAVSPADLIPVRYQEVGEDSCFIARNCDKALENLCRTSLIVQTEFGSPLVLSVTLGFASIHDLKINIQPILLTALTKRYDVQKKLLILDNFHRDPDVFKTVYCPLSQSKTMAHVLKLSKTALGPFENLSLRHNELESLTMIDSSNVKSIKVLDLRNNELLTVDALAPLKTLTVSEIWLDHNPMCDNYSSAAQYVEAVRAHCPHMTKLDGVQVNNPGLPMIFKSYIKNWKRKALVEQFVHHFFTGYDHNDRNVLRGLYHDEAWYSTTVGTPTSPTSKKALEPFGSENRNLLIFGKNSQQLLYHGQDQILKIFQKLPASRHIFKSFCNDLIYDTPETVIIAVEGLFKLASSKAQIFSFNRTFILSALPNDEFKILNDQYHVFLPIQGIYDIDLKKYSVDDEKPPKFRPNCLSFEEKDEVLVTFQEITTMKYRHCEEFLKETDWDLKKAIELFLDDYKSGRISKEAF